MLIAHLDLKGALLRQEYLPHLLEDLASLGYDGVLLEYEDVFPFEGVTISAAPGEVWPREVLQLFLDTASKLGLEVIPLQQCLGHLEYVFRWDKWQALALDQAYPSTLDITNPGARDFVFGLLRQMLDAHPGCRYVHVGLDEAHALITHAAEHACNPIDLFLDHLEEICLICEARGAMPLLFSDILENHFSADLVARLRKFRDRVALCPWDYSAKGEATTSGRIAGRRVARKWFDESQNPLAPAIDSGTEAFEALDAGAQELFAPYFKDDHFTPLFWCDVWTKLGFRVFGVSASRTSEQGALLPNYDALAANIRAWDIALRRNEAAGHIVSSWARGTTWCPPNFSFDLTWPLLQEAARLHGKNPHPYFEGLAEGTVGRVLSTLGRCKNDWVTELAVADEMDQLEPDLAAHAWQWRATSLMARTLAWSRRASFAQEEVDYFMANTRPVPQEWQRRIDDQERAVRDGEALRERVAGHFGQRYAGDAYQEWLRDIFDVPMDRLRQCHEISLEKKCRSAARYAAPM